MTGVVLCGGQSTRMGTDKGLLQMNGKTWAEQTFNKLSSLQIPVVVSVNKQQFEVYSKIFVAEKLITDDESLNLKGPLLGLMSVHQQLKQEDIFILACDMPDMNVALLQNLLGIYPQETNEVYVYTTDKKQQPLCGIYASSALNEIYKLYQQQQLKKFSMMYVLERLNTNYIPISETFVQCFNNYNSPEDLNATSN